MSSILFITPDEFPLLLLATILAFVAASLFIVAAIAFLKSTHDKRGEEEDVAIFGDAGDY